MDLSLKIVDDEVRASMNQEVATVNGKRVTRGQLAAAFDIVSNKENWKCPIDAHVRLTDDEIAMVTEAVIFFAGCTPEIERKSRKAEDGTIKYRVTAIGYYEAIGA